jgi:hypothetical protein
LVWLRKARYEFSERQAEEIEQQKKAPTPDLPDEQAGFGVYKPTKPKCLEA